jgi:hypothetical protein
MKSLGAVLAAAMLLGACSNIGMFGFELKITSDEVTVMPLAEDAGADRSHCTPGDVKKNWC